MKLISAIPAFMVILVLAIQPKPPTIQPITLVAANVYSGPGLEFPALRSVPKDTELENWGCIVAGPRLWMQIGATEYILVRDQNGLYIENACKNAQAEDLYPYYGHGAFGNT